MVELPDDELFDRHADMCQVLSNAKRQKLLFVLEEDERTVSDLAEITEIPQPTVSQHLRKMRDKGVVTKRTEGNNSYYRIKDERIIKASNTIRQVLLDALEKDRQFSLSV